MKALRIIAGVLLAAVSLCAAAAAVYICNHFVDAKPMLLTPPDVARSKVIMMMNAVSEGDYEEASQSIYGTPSLGVDREAADEVGALIWDAFRNSISYELQGECYTTEQGLAQNVSITCMDVTSVTVNLKERSQTLLEQRVEEAVDVSEIYDENNDYREDRKCDRRIHLAHIELQPVRCTKLCNQDRKSLQFVLMKDQVRCEVIIPG